MNVDFDPRTLGGNFAQGADGVWRAARSERVSYPEEGNQMCFDLEETSFWFRHRSACLIAALQRWRPAGVIFDIGGGNGFVARAMLDAGFRPVLIEPGEVGVQNARERGLPMVICGTLTSAQFPDATMPAVGLFDVLEHIERDVEFLREVHRCLIPSGRLYLTVPAFNWLWSDDDVAAGHWRRYTLASLRRKLSESDFRPLYMTYFFSPLPPPLFALRSIPSLFGHRALARKEYGRVHEPRAVWLTERIWLAERRAIALGRRIPVSSSCLLVAEKR